MYKSITYQMRNKEVKINLNPKLKFSFSYIFLRSNFAMYTNCHFISGECRMLFHSILDYFLLLSFQANWTWVSRESQHGKGNLFAVLNCIMGIYTENKTRLFSEVFNKRLQITAREILTRYKEKKNKTNQQFTSITKSTANETLTASTQLWLG